MKRRLLMVPVFLMAVCLSGCSPKITTETYVHELGEVLPENIENYATFESAKAKDEASIDLSDVLPEKVGIYEAKIILKNKEYSFNVEVVDTTPPNGSIEKYVTEVGPDVSVNPDSFGVDLKDLSEVGLGFRNISLYKTESEVYESFTKNMEEAREAGVEDILIYDLLNLDFDPEKDTWDETGVEIGSLETEFKPEENGLYKMELVAADIYGNADITVVYVLADLTAPEFVEIKDLEVPVSGDFEKYMQSMMQGLKAEDNYMGDMTDYIVLTNTEIINSTSSKTQMKLTYEVSDIVGNTTTGSRVLTIKATFASADNIDKVVVDTAKEQPVQTNGYDRARAEEAFAAVNAQRTAAGLGALAWDEGMYETSCRRASEIVNDFSHNGCPSNYGENIAGNYKSINNLINAWMNSPSHRDNILDGNYSAGAMGCYYYNGTYYWVNNFRY